MGLNIESYDFDRSWGGVFEIAHEDTLIFINLFFKEQSFKLLEAKKKLNLKILCLEPNKQISWQYPNKGSKLWKLLEGKAAYYLSFTEEESTIKLLNFQECLLIEYGVRHRLIGLNEWGIIAEICFDNDEYYSSGKGDPV